jgi:hypothetical protein
MRNHIVGKVYDVTADSINALVSQLEASTAENARLREALKQIAEIDSAFSSKRNCSYGDWELRLIAREALGPGDAK